MVAIVLWQCTPFGGRVGSQSTTIEWIVLTKKHSTGKEKAACAFYAVSPANTYSNRKFSNCCMKFSSSCTWMVWRAQVCNLLLDTWTILSTVDWKTPMTMCAGYTWRYADLNRYWAVLAIAKTFCT